MPRFALPAWAALSLIVCLLCRLPVGPRAAAGEKKAAPERIRPEGIDGALVLCGGGKVPEAALDQCMKLAGGEKAHLVIIPTASPAADTQPAETYLARWQARKPASAVVLHTRSRQTADDPKFYAPLQKATGVWFGGGKQSRIA